MPRRKPKRRKSKPKSRRDVKIKSHTRSPRGSDKGKPRVRVPAYRRRRPKDKR